MSMFEEPDEDMYEIELTAPQSDFYLGLEKYKLFVGGFGSGKTFTLGVCAVSDLLNFPGADIGVYAPTYDLLSLIAIPYIAELLECGGYVYKLNSSEHIFYVQGYGRIICRSMDNPSKIVGYEVFRSHCDELDTMTAIKAKDAWEKIIARNRQKIYKLDDDGNKIPIYDENGVQKRKQNVLQFEEEQNGVNAYTTPEGFRFAYTRWVKEKKENDGYAIYRVSSLSNPHLPDDYIENLRSTYSAELIDAYINGEFTNLKSGRVYRSFKRSNDDSDDTFNESWESVNGDEDIHVGMDFNIEHGAAVIHVVRKNGEHAVDEICDSYDTDDTIRVLKERYPNNRIFVYPDASGVKRSSGASNGVDTKGQATSTDMAKIKAAGFKVIVDSRNPLVKDRVAAVQGRILNGFGERRYFVNITRCPNLTNTLEQQTFKNGMPDKSTGLDHLGDCIGYYLCKIHPIVRHRTGFIRPKGRR